jgi:hypothetical protein
MTEKSPNSQAAATAPPGTATVPGDAVVNTTESPAELPGSVDLPPEDQIRRDLAFFVLRIVVGVMIAAFVLLIVTPYLGLNQEGVNSAIQLFFTATITLASTVFGFYFATRNK